MPGLPNAWRLPVTGPLTFAVLAALLLAAPAQADDDLMAMSLEELMQMDIGVASRVSRNAARQPVSVTTISREQIRGSAARTLNEVLMLHVPGFFVVEDQDDTIAAMRGMAPDNNSKIMLLLDGRNLNSEWFWGPPDAVLNGLDLEFIERIEVVRGPGSVTQGQGALLGVINIVTRSPAGTQGQAVAVQGGEDGRTGIAWRGRWAPAEDRAFSLYLADGEFDGKPYRNEGLGRQVEQGLSVFERNHHLKRGEYRNLIASADWDSFRVDLYRFDQARDLYNWRRDREVVREVLTGAQLNYRRPLGPGEVSAELFHHVDDYELRSHGGTRPEASRQLIPGLVLGGHRETRSGLRLLWTSESWLEGHRVALGADWNRYRSGQVNARGNNFIVNTQQAVLEEGYDQLNRLNRWGLPARTHIRSLFFEDFIALGERWEGFVAARWDDHPDWGSQVSPRLGLLWQQSERSNWRLSLQSGFRGAVGVSYSGGFEGDGLLREANFAEIENNPFFAAAGFANLQAVEPEKLTSLELGWNFQPAPDWTLQAVGFYNVTENVIGVGAYFLADDAARAAAIAQATRIGSDVIGDWGGVFYFQNNEGKLKHRGAEIELEYRRDDLGLRLAASHSHVRVASADAGQFGAGNVYVSGSTGDPHSRSVPEDVSRLQFEWKPLRLDGRLSLLYTQLHYPRWYPPVQVDAGGAPFTPKLDGNSIGQFGLDYRFARWPAWSANLQVKNLWNASALYPAASVAGEGAGNLGVPALERRSSWVTVRYQF